MRPETAFDQEWDDLADRIDAPPWLRRGWLRPFWRAFGGTPQPVVHRRHGSLAGLAPMMRRNGAIVSSTNWHTPAFGFLAVDEDAEDKLARVLVRRRVPRVTLAFLPAGRTLQTVRRTADGNHQRVLARVVVRSPWIAADASWEAYEQHLRPKLRRELRRRRRLLERSGELSFEITDGNDRLGELLDEGFAVEAAGWKGARSTAIASRANTERFYRDIAIWAASRGWLRLAYLRLDGRPLAFDFAIEAAGAHFLLKTGFDPAYARFAPGKLLRLEMIRRAFAARELERYEFLGADDAWKLEWTTERRDLWRIDCFGATAPGFLQWSAFAYGRPIAKRARAAARP
jgi:CelD/BcsL family acetyltransferase involved in cellulose biosynthesis